MDVIDIARFWSKVDVGHPERCWTWNSTRSSDGYGSFKLDGHTHRAHRVAYVLAYGEPVSDVIRHTCDNPLCVNPLHLTNGTHADNVLDRVRRNRSARGEKNGRAKLTEDAVRKIRGAPNAPAALLAEHFGVTVYAINAIRNGRNWKHVA